MEKFLMNKIAKVVFAALAVALCAGMWGCGNDETFEWKGRENARIVSFVDDSLALLFNRRGYKKCQEGVGPLGYSDCTDGGTNDGLFLVNFREKKPVYWADTLDFGVNFMRGFYRDSTILFLAEYEKKFGFWKIGSLPQALKKISWKSPCEGFDGKEPTQFRPWKNGDVLVINAKGCAFSVLDTATGDVDELTLDGECAWLKDCDDVTYLNGNSYCLIAVYDSTRYGVKLVKDGELIDSLIWKDAKWSFVSQKNIQILGDLFIINHPTKKNNYESNDFSGRNLNLLQPLKPLRPTISIDDAYSQFIDADGVGFHYEPDDLKF